MKKYKIILKGTVITFGLAVTMAFSYGTQVHAKYINHYTTPNELRGKWYSWDGKRFHSLYINRHSIISNDQGGSSIGNLTLRLHTKKAINHLHISKPDERGFYRVVNVIGDTPSYKLSSKKVHGKRGLDNGSVQGMMTRQKIKHLYMAPSKDFE